MFLETEYHCIVQADLKLKAVSCLCLLSYRHAPSYLARSYFLKGIEFSDMWSRAVALLWVIFFDQLSDINNDLSDYFPVIIFNFLSMEFDFSIICHDRDQFN